MGHGERCHGHYGRWREKHFPGLKLGADHAQAGEKFVAFSSYKSNLPLDAHYSIWIARQAMEYLDAAGERPFYLNVSFPDPHHPFTPPAPWHSVFADVEFPPPHAREGENEGKPKPYREAMRGNPFPTDGGARFFPGLAGRAYQQVVAHTYAMVALIDDCIGQVLRKLESKGWMQDTVLVFTSDHGDFLGDHHFLFKGQLPCRSLLHIPLMVVDPDVPPGISDEVCSNVDVMPTLLASCGLEVPETVQGVGLPSPGCPPRRDYAFVAGWSKASHEFHHYSLYKDRWRLTVFPNLRDGELYDLADDSWEHKNLFHASACRAVRDGLMEELLYAVGAAEPRRPRLRSDW